MNVTQVPVTAEIVAEDIGIGRLLIMSYLIFLMQCGFALLEAGTVRYRLYIVHTTTTTTLLVVLCDTTITTLHTG